METGITIEHIDHSIKFSKKDLLHPPKTNEILIIKGWKHLKNGTMKPIIKWKNKGGTK